MFYGRAAQVCLDISNGDTLNRELGPLVAAAGYYGCRENYIITLNQEKSFKMGGVTVNALPAWRWMLEME